MDERIEPLEPPYADEVAEDLRKLMPPGMEPIRLFRVLAKNPRLLRRIRRGGLLDPGAVSLRHRELMILRTTALTRAEYEWGVHAAFFAAAAKLTEAQVAATYTGKQVEGLSDADRVVLKLATELHEQNRPSRETRQVLKVHFGEAAILELCALAGQYHAISYVVNTARVELEPDAPRFPRQSVRPPAR